MSERIHPKPRTLEGTSKPLERYNPSRSHVFRLEMKNATGASGEAFMQAYNETINQFIDHLDEINSPNRANVESYVQFLSQAETRGPGKELMSDGLEKTADTYIEYASKNKCTICIVCVTDEKLKGGHSDGKHLQKEINRTFPCLILSLEELLIAYMTGSFHMSASELSHHNIREEDLLATLNNIFLCNDFTLVELKECCDRNGYDFDKVKNIIFGMKKLNPIEAEGKVDRKFVHDLDIDYENTGIVDLPIKKSELTYEIIQDGPGKGQVAIVNKEGDELHLKNLILRKAEPFGGHAKYFEHDNPKLSFNVYDIVDLLNSEHSSFVFEDIQRLPHVQLPLKVERTENGISNPTYSPKLRTYGIRTRIGFIYDPSVKQKITPISIHGNFDLIGEPYHDKDHEGNIGITVLKDDYYIEARIRTLQLMRSLDEKEAEWFHNKLGENLQALGFQKDNSTIPFSTLPYFISESAFDEICKVAGSVGEKITQAKNDRSLPVSFTLNTSINPNFKK